MSQKVTPAGFPQSFPIKFTRPFQIGDRFHLHTIRREEESSTTGDQPPQTSSSFIELDADITILQISSIGLPIAESITIRTCSLLLNDSPIPAPPPFSIIQLAPNPTATGQDLTLATGELHPTAAKLLKLVLPTLQAAQFDTDLSLGTSDPQKVDDQWSVNQQEFTKNLAAMGVTIDPTNITGTVSFDKTSTESNQTILYLTGHIIARNFNFPHPPNVEIVASSIDSTVSYDLPADPTLPLRREADSVLNLLEILITGPSGPIPAKRSSLTTTQSTYTPIPPTQK
jgi:hypothetical protein